MDYYTNVFIFLSPHLFKYSPSISYWVVVERFFASMSKLNFLYTLVDLHNSKITPCEGWWVGTIFKDLYLRSINQYYYDDQRMWQSLEHKQALHKFEDLYNHKYKIEDCQINELIDSGVYAMFTRGMSVVLADFGCASLDDYVRRYGQIIKMRSAKHRARFIELDIGAFQGYSYEDQMRYRKMLEDIVGAAPVPVFHIIYPLSYFYEMLENSASDTVALSFSRTRFNFKAKKSPAKRRALGLKREQILLAKAFTMLAHRHGKRLHLLGSGASSKVKICSDSCDSSHEGIMFAMGELELEIDTDVIYVGRKGLNLPLHERMLLCLGELEKKTLRLKKMRFYNLVE